MHKTIRIIATDLDGTMLHHDNEVSVRNYRAIEHAVNEGMLYAPEVNPFTSSGYPYP